MNPKYHQVVLGQKMGPPNIVRSSREGLKELYNLEKWKTLVFPYFMIRPNFSRKKKSHNMITTENIRIWNCQRPVLRNEIVYKWKSRNKNF